MRKNSNGFTLIELLVVIFIIAIVAAGVLYALSPARRIGESNDVRRKTELVAIAKAVELYTADHGKAPTELTYAGIVAGSKYVLCSSAGTLTCAGQTLACRVVDDTDFIGVYLPSLPIDPSKSATTDTGYYISRSNNNTLVLGSCTSYSSTAVQVAAQVNLPTFAVSCGDGTIGGSEVCDYIGTACPNNASYRYSGYAYDGSTCISSTYACDTTCAACINQASCTGTCGAGGIYSAGYCYYLATNDTSTCNDVCTNNNSTCTDGSWNDNATCTMATNLGATCNTCTSNASARAPAYDSANNVCYYRSSGNGACTQTFDLSDYRRICGCNS